MCLLVTRVFSQGMPVVTLPNGSTLYASYDSTNSQVIFNAIVMPNTYLAIGYGTSMVQTDMAFWGANSTASVMYDMYSTSKTTP